MIYVLLCGVLALAYLPMVTRRPGMLRSLVKTLSVAGLSLVAFLSGAPEGLAVALALCSLGDWFLSRDGDRAFMAGVAAFAAGHIAYGLLFLNTPGSDAGMIFYQPGIWGALAFAGFGLLMARVLVPRAGELRGAVLVYIPIILGMGLAALTLPRIGGLVLVLPAALAFFVSDTLLAVEKFVLPERHPAARLTAHAVWPLYWGAQAGFLLAFV